MVYRAPQAPYYPYLTSPILRTYFESPVEESLALVIFQLLDLCYLFFGSCHSSLICEEVCHLFKCHFADVGASAVAVLLYVAKFATFIASYWGS